MPHAVPAPLPGHVVVFSYFAGLSVLLFTLTTVLAKSLIRLGAAPEAAGAIEDNVRAVLGRNPDLDDPGFAAVSNSPEVAWTMLILLAGPSQPVTRRGMKRTRSAQKVTTRRAATSGM